MPDRSEIRSTIASMAEFSSSVRSTRSTLPISNAHWVPVSADHRAKRESQRDHQPPPGTVPGEKPLRDGKWRAILAVSILVAVQIRPSRSALLRPSASLHGYSPRQTVVVPSRPWRASRCFKLIMAAAASLAVGGHKYARAVAGEQQIRRRHVESSRVAFVHLDPRRGDGQVGQQARFLLLASFLVLIQVQHFADNNTHQFVDALGLGNLVADDADGRQRLAQSLSGSRAASASSYLTRYSVPSARLGSGRGPGRMGRRTGSIGSRAGAPLVEGRERGGDAHRVIVAVGARAGSAAARRRRG